MFLPKFPCAAASLLCVLIAPSGYGTTLCAEEPKLAPWSENPWYWSFAGEPVMLLGGSDDDNLFQWPKEKLLPQLDRIKAAGGNVIRNTMSDRKDGGFEVYPFQQLDDGRFDLNQWNPIYWNRFQRLLEETAKREIFVQIEIWDRFDYTDVRASDPKRWEKHPYNPANNINYTFEETGLQLRYPEHPGANKQPFFFTTPAQRHIQPVLKVQEAFVNRLLDISLQFDHVLYCIDNETKAQPEWARHWTALIRKRAAEAKKTVMVTEMWDDWDLKAERHRQTFDHPDVYDYVDVSQNNQNSGQNHWDNFLYVREYLSRQPRPMNTTKTYGADGNKFKHTDQDAIERFWRHLLAGAASIRFHRPDSGLGINDQAVNCIRSARMLEKMVPFWELAPATNLLGERHENEAYAASSTTQSCFVVYFPASDATRSVELPSDLPWVGQASGTLSVRWLNIDTAQWGLAAPITTTSLACPYPSGNHVAMITAE